MFFLKFFIIVSVDDKKMILWMCFVDYYLFEFWNLMKFKIKMQYLVNKYMVKFKD